MTKHEPLDKEMTTTPCSLLTGDRLCIECGYNLSGQVIVREPHYGLFIVRCPECGKVADIQEYPLLGRWAPRWGVLIAGMWFLALFALLAPTTAALWGMTVGTSETAADKYAGFLRHTHAAFVANQKAAIPPNLVAPDADAAAQAVIPGATFEIWWADQDPEAMWARCGGWRGGIEWRAFLLLVPMSLAVFAIGCFWSVALLGLRRRWLLVWGLFLILLASGFVAAACASWSIEDPRWWSSAARQRVGPMIAPLTMAYLFVPLSAGLLSGRGIVRLLVRALLPPRMRSSLAMLWIADGKPPPGTA